MTRSPTHNVGPVPRSGGSPRRQARLHARRRENAASSALGGRRASAPGIFLCRFVPYSSRARPRPRAADATSAAAPAPAPAIRRLVGADEVRFASLCRQITLTRQKAET